MPDELLAQVEVGTVDIAVAAVGAEQFSAEAAVVAASEEGELAAAALALLGLLVLDPPFPGA